VAEREEARVRQHILASSEGSGRTFATERFVIL
jgi:hypothetical protein